MDRAPVGDPGDGQRRDLLQRGLVVERRGQHLAGFGQEGEAALGRLLPLEKAGPVEGLGAILGQGQGERLLVGAEGPAVLPAETEPAQHPAVGHEGHRGQRSRAGRRQAGIAGLDGAPAADPHRLAVADGVGQRMVGGEGKALREPDAIGQRPGRGHHFHAAAVAGEEGHHAAGRTQRGDALADQDAGHPLRGRRLRQRGGDQLQPGDAVSHPLGSGPSLLGLHPDRLFATQDHGPLGLGQVARGHVQRDHHHADQFAAVVEQGRVDHVGENRGAVLAAHRELAFPGGAAGQPGDHFAGGRDVVGRHAELDDVAADRLGLRPAIDPFGLVVPVHDPAGGVGDDHGCADPVEHVRGDAVLSPDGVVDGVGGRQLQQNLGSRRRHLVAPPAHLFGTLRVRL